eukprot:348456-Lingulodinium_polyedra.AAC.1
MGGLRQATRSLLTSPLGPESSCMGPGSWPRSLPRAESGSRLGSPMMRASAQPSTTPQRRWRLASK